MAQIAVDANDVAVHNVSRRRSWRIALAVVAFLIYASTVFILPQVRDSRYCCEQSSFAAAVSHIMYGSRVGSMYTGVFDTFMTHFTEPLPQTLEAMRDELPAQPAGCLRRHWTATASVIRWSRPSRSGCSGSTGGRRSR